MRIAVAQFSAGSNKAENLKHIAALAERAEQARARVVIFPEASMHGFGTPADDLHRAAEPLDGRFVERLSDLAARLNITVVAGMFELLPDNQRVGNTAVVVGPQGGLVAAYRKRHLFDAFGDRESVRLCAGTEDLPIIEMGGFSASVAICYDLRFPAFIQAAADRGAELLLVPSAWVAGPLKEEHWSILLRARAIENTMYVAAAAMTGSGYCGRSAVIDPFGVIAASLGETVGIAVADVSKNRLADIRGRLPVVAQRRSESSVGING